MSCSRKPKKRPRCCSYQKKRSKDGLRCDTSTNHGAATAAATSESATKLGRKSVRNSPQTSAKEPIVPPTSTAPTGPFARTESPTSAQKAASYGHFRVAARPSHQNVSA